MPTLDGRAPCAGLLAWDPLTRLGCLTDGAADVKSHPWFEDDIDWDLLADMKVPPPHVPELRSTTDMTHFDDPTVDPRWAPPLRSV